MAVAVVAPSYQPANVYPVRVVAVGRNNSPDVVALAVAGIEDPLFE